MSDKILLLVLALCLGFGGYKLISNKLNPPEPAETAEAATPAPSAPPAVAAPPPPPAAEAAVEKPPAVKEALPPKVSMQELTQLFRVDGIANGANGRIVMINNKPLHEGETLDDLRVEKIMTNYVKVFYKGHSYQLERQLLSNSNN